MKQDMNIEITRTTLRTQITIEGVEAKENRIRGGRSAFCTRCQAQTIAYTPEQIAVLLQISLTEVCCRVESARIHLTQNGRSAAKICGNSL